MFGWLKAWQIGAYVLQKIKEFLDGGATSFEFDVSYRGQKYRISINVAKAAASSNRKTF